MDEKDQENVERHEEKSTPKEEDTEKLVLDVMDFLYGWVPGIGHALGLVALFQGKKRRAKFFFIYSTIGLIALIIFGVAGAL